MPPPADPLHTLWTQSFKAHLDALVLQFESQVRQHTAAQTAATERERAELRQELAAAQTRLTAATENLTAGDKVLKERSAELARSRAAEEQLRAENARLQGEIASLRATLQRESEAARRRDDEGREALRRLEGQLRELGQQVQTLDEQFVGERAFVDAIATAATTPLFEAVQQSLGAPVEPTPACFALLKSKKPDAVLAQAMRERGRAVVRAPLSDRERASLGALAGAAGCELIDVSVGVRFSPLVMEKALTRVDPSEEDMVLECLFPGLRIAGTDGSLLHPRVVVGIA